VAAVCSLPIWLVDNLAIRQGLSQLLDLGSGNTTYEFDANGSPVGERTTRGWDYENQTILAELPNGSRVTMVYNADNRRVRKESIVGVANYIWDLVTDQIHLGVGTS